MEHELDIDTLNEMVPPPLSQKSSNIWDDMTLQQLAHAHPNWEAWSLGPSQGAAAEYVASVRAKLLEGNHGSLAKCVVEPVEARSLSEAQGIDPDAGFWLIPPLRAPSDVRLFSCGDRCVEAGTTIMIPEHKVGYPAAKGSIVTVRKGEFYGIGVLNTNIFDEHIKAGMPCCSKELVMLRSVKKHPPQESDVSPLSSVQDLANAIGSVSYQGGTDVITGKDKMLLAKPMGPVALMAGPLRRPSPNSQMHLNPSLRKTAPTLQSKTNSERSLVSDGKPGATTKNSWIRSKIK
ncbi:hypothetical protein BC830DRAFT_1096084 [Chytriomyces sp. MP71]|nr:hypothetical protein BC830DRAFT_1096084 [Chytriomyces sp. MP71]